jgi:hypothetical protein
MEIESERTSYTLQEEWFLIGMECHFWSIFLPFVLETVTWRRQSVKAVSFLKIRQSKLRREDLNPAKN